MSSLSNEELITMFMEATGCDENVAQFYLGSSNYELEVNLFHNKFINSYPFN